MADDFYLAGMKNWRSFASVIAGDLQTAARMTAEALGWFEERDDHYFVTWTLWIQALVALAEGRATDAIELATRQFERFDERGRVGAGLTCKESGYRSPLAPFTFTLREDIFIIHESRQSPSVV